MRRIWASSLLSVLVIACAPMPGDSRGASDEVKAALEGYRTALEGKDIAAIEQAFYQPIDSVTVIFLQATVNGKAIIDGMRGFFAADDSIHVIFRDVRIRVAPSGDAAWVSLIEDGSELVNGKKEEWRGRRATFGWLKQDGDWRIVQMHWSDVSPSATTKK